MALQIKEYEGFLDKKKVAKKAEEALHPKKGATVEEACKPKKTAKKATKKK